MWDNGESRGNGRGGGLPLNANINVTSLVDVAFTLLIIFIITAPILQGGVEVQLPRAESSPITATDGVIVTITSNGEIYIGDVAVETTEDFEVIFPEYVQGREIRDAYVKADRDVPYGRVLQVLGLMNRLDVADVGLVSDPEMERGLH